MKKSTAFLIIERKSSLTEMIENISEHEQSINEILLEKYNFIQKVHNYISFHNIDALFNIGIITNSNNIYKDTYHYFINLCNDFEISTYKMYPSIFKEEIGKIRKEKINKLNKN